MDSDACGVQVVERWTLPVPAGWFVMSDLAINQESEGRDMQRF